MRLNKDKILEIIEKGASPELIKARKRAKINRMHITGKGTSEFLEIIDSYENDAQLSLRKKLVKSNKSTFNYLTKPMDKVFTAKGGSINFNLSKGEYDTVMEKVSESSDNLNIKRYLKKNVKLPYLIDANAVLMCEVGENKVKPAIVYSQDILWYSKSGNKVEAIIFEGYKKSEKPAVSPKTGDAITIEGLGRSKYYRVYDESEDALWEFDGGDIRKVEEETFPNEFGTVPAIILGDEADPNDDMFNSLIYPIAEDASQFLRRASTMNVHELAHLYSRYWSYAQACNRCEGEGVIADDSDPENVTYSTCNSCGGTGTKSRTNASDETVLPVPMDGDPVIAPNVAGYVSPDIDIAKFYNDLQEGNRKEMFQTLWGTTYETNKNRETATARYIDAQPVEDKLLDVSATFEFMHKFLLDFFVRYATGDRKYRSSVTYGNRYVLETADNLLTKYQKSSTMPISGVIISDLKNKYVEAEYQNDEIELAKMKKLMKIEPFPNMKISEVLSSSFINDEEKRKKLYFDEWSASLKGSQIVLWSIKRLSENLVTFLTQKPKLKEDEKLTLQGGGIPSKKVDSTKNANDEQKTVRISEKTAEIMNIDSKENGVRYVLAEDEGKADNPDIPSMDWTKAEIVGYLNDNEIEIPKEATNKALLLELIK